MRTSTSARLQFDVVQLQGTSTTANRTQILGRLSGAALLFDQTFDGTFGAAAVQQGVVAAKLAITATGGPAVVIGEPTLTGRFVSTVQQSSSTYRVVQTSTSVVFEDYIVGLSPVRFRGGDRTLCSNISATPSAARPTCVDAQGTVYQLVLVPPLIGAQVINVNTETLYTVEEQRRTDEVTVTTEQYTLTGMVTQAIGAVHGRAAALAGEGIDRFTRRLLDAAKAAGDAASPPPAVTGSTGATAAGGWRAWAEGYGSTGRFDATATLSGDRRTASGFAGGLAYALGGGFTIGAAFDIGRLNLTIPGTQETLKLDLPQGGLYASYVNGHWFATASALAGFGEVGAASPRPGGVAATAAYKARTLAFAAEAGRSFDLGGLTLTPSVGAHWRQVMLDGFIEQGPFALSASGRTASNGQVFGGLSLSAAAPTGASEMRLAVYARAVRGLGGESGRQVTFAGGGPIMLIDGPNERRWGLDAGASVALSLAAGVRLTAGYDARIRSNAVDHVGKAGLSVRF